MFSVQWNTVLMFSVDAAFRSVKTLKAVEEISKENVECDRLIHDKS